MKTDSILGFIEKTKGWFLMGAVIVCILFLAPAVLRAPEDRANDRPVIAATVFPIYDMTRIVAGDAINVQLILPTNANPHTFEVSPSNVRALADAQVIYAIGYDIDAWAGTLLQDRAADVDLVLLDGNIEHRIITTDQNVEVDPHYWLTIPNAKSMVDAVASDLTRRFPDHANEFETNRAAYQAQLDQAERETRAILAGVENRNIVTQHDAWYYFADAYDLNIVGTFEPSSGKEPTPQYLAELSKTIDANHVPVIYGEPQSSEAEIESFAADHGLKIEVLDDVGGTPGIDSYISLMLTNARSIANNQ